MQFHDFYDAWGTDEIYNHFAVPWAWAFDTPFRWTKQIAAHFGDTRQGMAIAWPKVITDAGGIRDQFAHFIDIAPTILEATGIREPSEPDGGHQPRLHLRRGQRRRALALPDQYFEMFGTYAIYHEGWIGSTKITRPSWVTFGSANLDPASAEWELFDLASDWTRRTTSRPSTPRS